MPFYVKKPVVIEAKQITRESIFAVSQWCNGELVEINDSTEPAIKIHTLEGDHLGRLGDYVIKGIKGEFYPCKSDIFEETYEITHETEVL